MLWLKLGGPRGCPGPAVPEALPGSTRQRCSTKAKHGGGRWREVGAWPLDTEAAAMRQTWVCEWELCCAEGPSRGTHPDHQHPPALCQAHGVSCCAGGIRLQTGEETLLRGGETREMAQVFGKFSMSCVYWAWITQVRAGLLLQDY